MCLLGRKKGRIDLNVSTFRLHMKRNEEKHLNRALNLMLHSFYDGGSVQNYQQIKKKTGGRVSKSNIGKHSIPAAFHLKMSCPSRAPEPFVPLK